MISEPNFDAFLTKNRMEDKFLSGLIEKKLGLRGAGARLGFQEISATRQEARTVHFQQQCGVYGG